MINLIKKNWISAVLILVIIYLFSRNYNQPLTQSGAMPLTVGSVANVKMMASDSILPYRQAAPSESSSRLVIQDTSLSLQVNDVDSEIKNIENTTNQFGGFLVNSNLSKPDGAASGTITVRVPESKRAEAMASFKQNAVKVVSESISGTDVTDQYSDLDAQLAVLNKTKVKFEEIMDKAVTVSDLMNVQQQLVNLQQQIDSVKGQQKFYEQSAKLSKITVYLSTDDLALPYAPTTEWRPAVVFKTAIRSLVGTFRNIADLFIWLVVYSPIVALIVVVAIWYRKKYQK